VIILYAFFKILICKNFKKWNIQIQGLFKDFQGPTLFSRTFRGLEFFLQNSRTFKDFSYVTRNWSWGCICVGHLGKERLCRGSTMIPFERAMVGSYRLSVFIVTNALTNLPLNVSSAQFIVGHLWQNLGRMGLTNASQILTRSLRDMGCHM